MGKSLSNIYDQNFSIALKNLQQMQEKQHRKVQFKTQEKQLVI